MRQGWKSKVDRPVFAPHLTRSELCGIIGDAPERVMAIKTSAFTAMMADVTGIALISDGRFALACSCARMNARARHSGQMLSGFPPGCNSRPQLTQVGIWDYSTKNRSADPVVSFLGVLRA